MARPADEKRIAAARRLYAAGESSALIADVLGVNRRQVQRWCADFIRPPGARPMQAVTDERVVYLRDTEGLSWAQVASLTGLGYWTSARERYRAATGTPRPDRPPPRRRTS